MLTEKEQLREDAIKAVRAYIAKCGPEEAFCVPLTCVKGARAQLLVVGADNRCFTLLRMWFGL